MSSIRRWRHCSLRSAKLQRRRSNHRRDRFVCRKLRLKSILKDTSLKRDAASRSTSAINLHSQGGANLWPRDRYSGLRHNRALSLNSPVVIQFTPNKSARFQVHLRNGHVSQTAGCTITNSSRATLFWLLRTLPNWPCERRACDFEVKKYGCVSGRFASKVCFTSAVEKTAPSG